MGPFPVCGATATPGYALNDKGFSLTGPVISYVPTTGENQVWLVG